MIVLDENPLEHIRNTRSIRYVIKNGRLFEGDTLNELWPRQVPLGPLPWNGDNPPNTDGEIN